MGIRAQNVVKRFGDFVALDDVSVDIPTGSLTALLGPERWRQVDAAAHHRRSRAARLRARSRSPAKTRHPLPPQQRNVGFVFQHYAAFKHMTVRGNVAFGLEIRKRPKNEIKDRVDELLSLVHLVAVRRPVSRRSSRVGSGNVWRWPGRWQWSRRCCCWTSRSVRSMRRSARSCATGCVACTTRCTSPPCSSPTIRRRRWRSPTRSSSSTTAPSSRSAHPTSSTTNRSTTS